MSSADLRRTRPVPRAARRKGRSPHAIASQRLMSIRNAVNISSSRHRKPAAPRDQLLFLPLHVTHKLSSKPRSRRPSLLPASAQPVRCNDAGCGRHLGPRVSSTGCANPIFRLQAARKGGDHRNWRRKLLPMQSWPLPLGWWRPAPATQQLASGGDPHKTARQSCRHLPQIPAEGPLRPVGRDDARPQETLEANGRPPPCSASSRRSRSARSSWRSS